MVELNGIANIKISLELARASDQISSEIYNKIYEQIDFLERYMICMDEALSNQSMFSGLNTLPQWHEIKQSHLKYPNIKEKNEP